MQSELSPFANSLFFGDHINLFELYNGLVKAHSQNKELGLDETIRGLESRYGEILKNNNTFREIERTAHDELLKISQG